MSSNNQDMNLTTDSLLNKSSEDKAEKTDFTNQNMNPEKVEVKLNVQVNNSETGVQLELKDIVTVDTELEKTNKKVETINKNFLSISQDDRNRLAKGKINNLDAKLKFLTKKLYERKGYYCEVECRLYEESYLGKYKKEEISDVDVLGIKYEPDLKKFMVGIECKSTSNNGLDELLKVRGLQELLELDYVGLVKHNVSSNVRLVANKLDVQLHSEKELISILESMVPDIGKVLEDEAFIYLIKDNIEKELKKEIKGIINFVNSGYWTNEGYQNINTIVRVVETFKGRTFTYYQIKYILLRLATLLSITLLDVASLIIKSNYSNLEHISLDMLFGGATQRREKERAYDIISQELGRKLDPNPSFKNEYINLINWIVKEPYHARYLPQCINFYLECFIIGSSYDLISKSFSPITIKLAKDVLKFISNISGTDQVHQDFFKL
jgi:hypothetical protein